MGRERGQEEKGEEGRGENGQGGREWGGESTASPYKNTGSTIEQNQSDSCLPINSISQYR